MKTRRVIETEATECAIYFDDLKPEAQKFLLEFYGAEEPVDMRWHIRPLFELYRFES